MFFSEVTPQDRELLDVDVLFAEFEAAALQFARVSFDELVKLMVGVFCKVASHDSLLCQTLQTEYLRDIAQEMGALEALAKQQLQVRNRNYCAEQTLGEIRFPFLEKRLSWESGGIRGNWEELGGNFL